MEIKKVGVVGLGLMGAGIAQVCAQAGFQTVAREVNDDLVGKGRSRIEGLLAKDVSKGKLSSEDRDAIQGRLTYTTAVEDLVDCDLVIEAIIENPDAKRDLFATLDRLCPAETIFASNTSSIPIIEIAAATKRPDRFAGLHFFNPVPVMKLVEIIRSISTSAETMGRLRTFGQQLGKQVVEAPDTPGFIVNRLLVPYLLDAVRLLEEGVSKEDIDEGMRLGCGYPMGPLTLLDFVGLDTTYYIANIMFDEYKEPRYAPPTMLKRMVLAGHYGRKSGKGFYDYSEQK